MLPNHGSVQGELFPGSVVCDARTQGLHEGPFTVIFRRKLGGMRWRRTLALAWPKLACLTWLAGEVSAQRLLTVLASYIIDSTPAGEGVLPGRSGISSGADDDEDCRPAATMFQRQPRATVPKAVAEACWRAGPTWRFDCTAS